MVIYDSVRSIMNTTENMEHLVVNTRYDGTTLQYQGVDWFQFNGKVISNIFVSDNSFIGLGSRTEHLLVCRRDASLYNFYREEGSLFGTIRFLKLRWEGYAQYNNTTEDVRLVYEWFFFETGDMFLNLIKAPNATGYLGTSRINGGMNQDFAVTVTQQQYISFFHKDNNGKKFDISYSVIDFAPPFESKYSKNTEMNDSTILGIESIEIDSDDNTLFAFSFDGGTTWKAYTEGKWAVLSEETSGMNRESVKAVGTDAWNEAASDKQYKIRFALREGGFVNRITVHYLN